MSTHISTRTVYTWACSDCRVDGLSTDLSVAQFEAEVHEVDIHGDTPVTVSGLR